METCWRGRANFNYFRCRFLVGKGTISNLIFSQLPSHSYLNMYSCMYLVLLSTSFFSEETIAGTTDAVAYQSANLDRLLKKEIVSIPTLEMRPQRYPGYCYKRKIGTARTDYYWRDVDFHLTKIYSQTRPRHLSEFQRCQQQLNQRDRIFLWT